jgi:hypothetical protein
VFVTSGGHTYAEFQRALKNGNLWIAEAVARELPQVWLEDALNLVRQYAKKESPKYERAAVKWLRRYLNEASPELSEVAKVVGSTRRAARSALGLALDCHRALSGHAPVMHHGPRAASTSCARVSAGRSRSCALE